MKQKLAEFDNLMMMECLLLAQKGAGHVSPNPMVGAVLVKKNRVIARGYHRRFGGPHAEVDAIHSAKGSVRGATLYVNLEPCNISGKTPPCTDLIISSKISRVVIGMKDPNPRVSGRGISQLRRAGITVTLNTLRHECERVNESFAKFITTGIPFVSLKIAQTLDGKIADAGGRSRWISNSSSRTLVHTLRARYDAVLVGVGTIHKDNPQLTVRSASGRNPIKVIIDGNLSIRKSAKVLASPGSRTIIFTSSRVLRLQSARERWLRNRRVELIGLPSKTNGLLSIKSILATLGGMGIASVLVEGGATVYSHFLRERAADKLILFIAPKILGTGPAAFDSLQDITLMHPVETTGMSTWKIDGDLLLTTYLDYY